MKYEKKGLWSLALLGIFSALMISGCHNSHDSDVKKDETPENPVVTPIVPTPDPQPKPETTEVDAWLFSKVSEINVSNSNQIAMSGDCIMMINGDQGAFLSTDGGKTFGSTPVVIAAGQVSDATKEMKMEGPMMMSVFSHPNGFVFRAKGKGGMIVTDRMGKGMMGFSASGTEDGLADADIMDAVVGGDGNVLVVAQMGQNTVIDLTKKEVVPMAQRALYNHEGNDTKIGNVTRLGVGINGDVFAVVGDVTEVWHYLPANLMMGSDKKSKAEDAVKYAEFAHGKGVWTHDDRKMVSAVTATKDGMILFAFGGKAGYIYGMPGAAALATDDNQKPMDFWMDFTSKEVYARSDEGLRMINAADGKCSASLVNEDMVSTMERWTDGSDTTKVYKLGAKKITAYCGSTAGNIMIATGDHGLHLGVKSKLTVRK